MSSSMNSCLKTYRDALAKAELNRRIGWIQHMQGLSIESQGPDVSVGELCRVMPRASLSTQYTQDLRKILPARHASADSTESVRQAGATPLEEFCVSSTGVLAEVVGFKAGHVTLMPYGSLHGISVGSEVIALGHQSQMGVGPGLLGRVIDSFGHALDGLPDPATTVMQALHKAAPNPMHRPRIQTVLETGIRSMDALLTLGQGQRVGIFSGSGVGKSTLLGLIARHVKADVNVIALIGERGREVREFIDKQLGEAGLKRSVVVVATSDQPALARVRAAYAAVAIAEYFRQAGKQVLLTMDSITRLAMARREIGLSAGEPPTARGYTPSVFAELPQLCERCGTAESGGSITALLTVLVEGDDLNEPISDSLRSILDGHIVLSRQLAHQGLYPAIDLLKSTSRLFSDLTNADERSLALASIKCLSLLERHQPMVQIGAYTHGSQPELDLALAIQPKLHAWLSQSTGGALRANAISTLREIMKPFMEYSA